mmetsp:Transcript_202/g.424  ORF Transcript_202/g.424 Transcript_202/m.424 type:complete len:268 (-) Transcript_202:604-1407(-)
MPPTPASPPPMAGPSTVPDEKATVIGAIMRARLSGVEMSATEFVAPASSAETPTPVIARAQSSVSTDPAKESASVDREMTHRPAVMLVRRPYLSTRTALGTFERSLAAPKAETTAPYCASPNPSERTSSGITGVVMPTATPATSIVIAIGQIRLSRASAITVTLCLNCSYVSSFAPPLSSARRISSALISSTSCSSLLSFVAVWARARRAARNALAETTPLWVASSRSNAARRSSGEKVVSPSVLNSCSATLLSGVASSCDLPRRPD